MLNALMQAGYSYEEAYQIVYGEPPTTIDPDFVNQYKKEQKQFDQLFNLNLQDQVTIDPDFVNQYKKEQKQFDQPFNLNLPNLNLPNLNLPNLNLGNLRGLLQNSNGEITEEGVNEEITEEGVEGTNQQTAFDSFLAGAPFFNAYGMSTPSALYNAGRSFASGKPGMGLAGLGLAGLRGAANILAGMGAQKRQDNTMDWYYKNLNRQYFESQPQYKDDATALGYAFEDGGRQARKNERKFSPAIDLFGRYGEVNYLGQDLPEYSDIQKFGYGDPGIIGSIKHAMDMNRDIKELNKSLPEDEKFGKVRALAFTGRRPTESVSFEDGGMKRYNFLRALKDSNADFTVDMEDELEDLKEDLFPELFKAGGKKGGIPERYKKRGFSKVGVKKRAPEGAKHKWEVLAKKGDRYKIVKGGYRGMDDFTQHKNKERQKRFWQRMGGKNSAKAKDPFSPLYWHKRFGTWEDGGEIEEQMAQDQAVAEQQSMMQEQQAMEDQEMVQQASQEQAMMQQQQQILAMIVQALQQGATPEQVVQVLVQNGIPEEQAMQMVQMVIQQMQGAAPQMNYGGLFQTPSFYENGGGKDGKAGKSNSNPNSKYRGPIIEDTSEVDGYSASLWNLVPTTGYKYWSDYAQDYLTSDEISDLYDNVATAYGKNEGNSEENKKAFETLYQDYKNARPPLHEITDMFYPGSYANAQRLGYLLPKARNAFNSIFDTNYKMGGNMYENGGIRKIYDKEGNPLSSVEGQDTIYVDSTSDPYYKQNRNWWNMYNRFQEFGKSPSTEDLESIPSYAISRNPSGEITSIAKPRLTYNVLKPKGEDTFMFTRSVEPLTNLKMGGETFMGKGPGEKISFNYGGKKYSGTIDRVENGKLYLK